MKNSSTNRVAMLIVTLIALLATLSACTGKPAVSDFKNKPEKSLFSSRQGENGFIRAGGSKEGPTFKLEKTSFITKIRTIHSYDPDTENVPGPGDISLKGANGKAYGPWRAKGIRLGDSGNVIVWASEPNILLEPGSYTVVDSDPSSWSPEPEPSKTGMAVVGGKQ